MRWEDIPVTGSGSQHTSRSSAETLSGGPQSTSSKPSGRTKRRGNRYNKLFFGVKMSVIPLPFPIVYCYRYSVIGQVYMEKVLDHSCYMSLVSCGFIASLASHFWVPHKWLCWLRKAFSPKKKKKSINTKVLELLKLSLIFFGKYFSYFHFLFIYNNLRTYERENE